MEENLIPCYGSNDVTVNWQDDNDIVVAIFMVDDINGYTYRLTQKLSKKDFIKIDT